ncbi:MAG: hypothetical protein WKF42_10205 [Solirubrobacteraceae bacterium]
MIAPASSRTLLLLLATTFAGCGDERPAPPREPVGLQIDAPQDGGSTRDGAVRVSGSVTPASSRVLVGGERVPVRDGRFSDSVDLREGANVIDVGATAPGARATWRALRVIRRSKIRLPDVVGAEMAAATATLEALGFDVRVTINDGLLDAFRDRPRTTPMAPRPTTASMRQPAKRSPGRRSSIRQV